jgi:cytochrome-b5 reductase
MFAALRSSRLVTKASLAALSVAAFSSVNYSVSSCSTEGNSLAAFSPKEFKPFPITKVVDISPNTKKITCALPSKDHEMGMTTSSMIMIKG